MSEQIREQVSAFLDGELPNTETELLLKRLTRDPELRDSFGRYALLGEAMRGNHRTVALTRGFAARINAAIDGEAVPVSVPLTSERSARWWRPLAGAAMVASVAAVAVVALQHRTAGPATAPLAAANTSLSVDVTPRMAPVFTGVRPGTVPANLGILVNREPSTPYATPLIGEGLPMATLPSGRLASYVFAHSKYSSGLGQRGVLADLLIEDDDAPVAKPLPVAAPAHAP
jgi:hypothetical protein